MEPAPRPQLEHSPSSLEHSASRSRGADPRFSRGPVRKDACDAKPEGVVDRPRPYALQADLCRGTRPAATGLHDRTRRKVRQNRHGENALSPEGAVVHRGVADAAGTERIRAAPWQVTGGTGRFPLPRACGAQAGVTARGCPQFCLLIYLDTDCFNSGSNSLRALQVAAKGRGVYLIMSSILTRPESFH